jgi:Regulator of chromosome condensation (RCC1) repeat
VVQVLGARQEGRLTFEAIAAGNYNTCGVTTSGTAYCWGWNFYGQLGTGGVTGTYDPHPTPTAVAGGLQFATIETGMNETCGLTVGGLAYCWGDNNSGQIGDGTYDWATAPVLVVGQR